MLSVSNLWRATVVVLVVVAIRLLMNQLTDDEGVVLLVAVLVGFPLMGALWPVELGLKAAPEDEPPGDPRPDAAPERT